jgi:hypothetical protein
MSVIAQNIVYSGSFKALEKEYKHAFFILYFGINFFYR